MNAQVTGQTKRKNSKSNHYEAQCSTTILCIPQATRPTHIAKAKLHLSTFPFPAPQETHTAAESLQNRTCSWARLYTVYICSRFPSLSGQRSQDVLTHNNISQNVNSTDNPLRRIMSLKTKLRLLPIYSHLAKNKGNKFSLIFCFCHHLSQDSLALFAFYVGFVGFQLLIYSKLK